MKAYYTKPESEITEFSAVEVISTSGIPGGDANIGDFDPWKD